MKIIYQLVLFLFISNNLFSQRIYDPKNLFFERFYINGNLIFIPEIATKNILRVGGQLKFNYQFARIVIHNENKVSERFHYVGFSLLNTKTFISDQREDANILFTTDRDGLTPFITASANYAMYWKKKAKKNYSFFSADLGFGSILNKNIKLFIPGSDGSYCYEYIKTGNGFFYSLEYGKRIMMYKKYSMRLSIFNAIQITRIRDAELYLYDKNDKLLSIENLKVIPNTNPMMGIKLGLVYSLN